MPSPTLDPDDPGDSTAPVRRFDEFPHFTWEEVEADPDDPLFSTLHVAFISDPVEPDEGDQRG